MKLDVNNQDFINKVSELDRFSTSSDDEQFLSYDENISSENESSI